MSIKQGNNYIAGGGGGGSVSIDNLSITQNSSLQIQTVGVIDSNNTTNAIKTWTGTKAQYEALLPTSTTYYAWTDSYNGTLYTTSSTPSVGDATYSYSGGVMGDNDNPITNIGTGWVAIMNEYSPSNIYNRNSSSDVTITSSGSIDANTLYNITDDTDVSLTILEALYPVGSVYITTANTCPLSTLISGSTWELVSSGRVLQGADSGHSAGTTVEAGLPNITGFTDWWSYGNGSNQPSGAFYTDLYTNSSPNSGTNPAQLLRFDASRSNSIYGNSTTVQPPAYIVNIYRRTA